MQPLVAAAKRHKAQFEALIASDVATVVSVVPAAPRPTTGTDADRVLGKRPTAVPTPVEVRAIASNPVPASGEPVAASSPKANGVLGALVTSDLVLRVRLSDVLVDPAKPYGATLFEGAKEVVVHGTKFKVDATDRSGLPPVGPYILWVGLSALV